MTNEQPGFTIAAVRGAVPVTANTAAAILDATERLLRRLLEVNGIGAHQVISAVFTATDDLDAEFPAHAARRLGWSDVPLICAREIAVAGSMAGVVRVLLTVSGVRAGARLTPVYLDAAAALRPDLQAAAIRTPSRPRTIAIIGLGQIGGSIGLGLGRSGGWWRVGYDSDPAVRLAARGAGAVDAVAASPAAAVSRAELAVVATPVDVLPAVIAEASQALPRGAALLDTGSARGPITPALEAAAKAGVVAVGGHPIAGTEGRGWPAARADLFTGCSFALFPTRGEIPQIIQDLVRDLGARSLVTTPEDHDEALARTSHLPYLLACALRDTGSAAAQDGLSGPGFRDMTRLAGSDPRMALAYCKANAGSIVAAWQEVRAGVERMIGELTPHSTLLS